MSGAYSVEWAEPALADAEHIVDYLLVHDSLIAADNLVAKIEKATNRLAQIPKRGRVVPELGKEGIHAYQEIILRPYRLIYRIERRNLVVVAFLDGRRDLGELLVARAMR